MMATFLRSFPKQGTYTGPTCYPSFPGPFPGSCASPPPDARWHDLILQHQHDIATIMTLECGKPLPEAMAEIASG